MFGTSQGQGDSEKLLHTLTLSVFLVLIYSGLVSATKWCLIIMKHAHQKTLDNEPCGPGQPSICSCWKTVQPPISDYI